jgi:hypothetical protein
VPTIELARPIELLTAIPIAAWVMQPGVEQGATG